MTEQKSALLSCGLFFLLCVSLQGFGQTNTINFDPPGTRSIFLDTGSGVFHSAIEWSGASRPPAAYLEIDGPGRLPLSSQVSFQLKRPVTSGRTFVEIQAPATVGVAFSNLNTQPAAISFFFTDRDGRDLPGGSLIIPANGQMARFLDQAPFAAPSGFRGTFTFTATAPVTVISVLGFVNEFGAFLMPQAPVFDAADSSTNIIPHFAACSSSIEGRPYMNSTDVIMVNMTDQPLTGVFTFLGQGSGTMDAQPVTVTIEGMALATFPYSIPSRSSRRFAMPPSVCPHTVGSIRIVPTAGTVSPATFGIVSFARDGVTIAQQSIPGQRPSTAFRVLADGFVITPMTGWSSSTSFVIANPSSTPASVDVDFETPPRRQTLTVPANGQVIQSTEAFFNVSPISPYSAVLRFSSRSPISVIALKQSFTAEFPYSREAVDETASFTGNASFVPHIPVGLQGYQSRIMMFRTSDTQASGVIRFFSQDATPIDPRTLGFR